MKTETIDQCEDEICQTPPKKHTSVETKSVVEYEDKVQTPKKQTSMKTETIDQYEDEICQTPSKEQSSMEIETVVQNEDEIYHISSKKQTSMEIETVAEHKNKVSQATKKQTSMEMKTVQSEDEIYQGVSKKRIYYAGDINLRNVENMTPKMLVKSLNILKKSCEKKDKIINRLRAQHCCQKKKIESLEALLSKFREKNIRSQIS
ncbi:uncharacterized protein LOC109856199 [Pseudomyrmex gracilis]|uniref:uncharacterized protein LOC109856199 n=1 Tax=Pseudomyrmex gracilis TaxID=219809 RepID=UPI0009955A9F|nr:uncharacterized protein LOC109856199 [Pseudomyrmex gracilis]